MVMVDRIADRMGRTPEAVFVFLKAEEYSVEILRKENRNTISPTMVKLILFHNSHHYYKTILEEGSNSLFQCLLGGKILG